MLSCHLILPQLPATSKKQVFRAIAEETSKLFHANPDDLLNALLDRERIGTTGIGGGVAIPHVKSPHAKDMYAVLAQLSSPVDYDAIDGQPVDIIYLLIAPEGSKTTQHLKMLAHISRFLKDARTTQTIRAAQGRDDIAALLTEWIKSQAAA